MKNYEYRAHNLAGRVVEGTLRANNTNEAYEQLSQDKLVPIEVQPAAAPAEGAVSRLFGERIKDEQILLFTRQLSAMLRAGIPIVQTIEILRDQVESRRFKQVLAGIGRTVSGGGRLSEALAGYPRVFSREYVSIVVTGESGGDMVKALSSLARWMEREMEIRMAIKAAVRYPIMVCVALVLASIVMLAFVIPRFAEFFAQTDVPLPLPTRMLVGGSDLLREHWLFVFGALAVAAVGAAFLLKLQPVRLRFDEAKFHIGLIGPLYTKIVIARFGRIFSMLIRNGVPVLKALDIAPNVVANTHFRRLLGNTRQFIQDGNSIADGFVNEMPIFPSIVTSLVAVGEKTGSLDDMLDHVVDFYDAEIDYTLRHLTSMIEPIVTVIIGAGVLFLALSIFLPIWNMSQALTAQVR